MVWTPITNRISGKEDDVLRLLGITLNGRHHILCPYPGHDDHKASWRWDSTKKRAFCTCIDGAHSLMDVVMSMRGEDFASSARWVEESLGLERQAPSKEFKPFPSSKPDSLLSPPSDQVASDVARTYLAHRLGVDPELVVMPTTRVEGWKSFPYFVAGKSGEKPVHLGDHPVAVFELVCKGKTPLAHRIYLNSSATWKASITGVDGKDADPKKLCTLPNGVKTSSGYVAVFGHPGCETLVVCEGIEDAAAVAFCLRGEIERGEVVVVAAVSGPSMAEVEVYRGTKRLIVAAHRDEDKPSTHQNFAVGERCAKRLIAKIKKRKRIEQVSLVLPGQAGQKVDWLNILEEHGEAAVREGILGGADLDGNPEQAEVPAAEMDSYFTVGSDVDVAYKLIDDLKSTYPDGLVGAEGSLWRYIGTHWEAIDDDELRRIVHGYDGIVFQDQLGKQKIINLTKSRIDSIVHEAMIHIMQPRFFDKPAQGINCMTGFIQFDADGNLQQVPHSPEFRCRAVCPGRYPVENFDQRFAGSLLEKLLLGCFLGDEDAAEKTGTIQEVAGIALAGYGTRLKDRKVCILCGPKAKNGKSAIIDMITEMLAEEARSAVPLQKIGDEKYRVRLRGSLLNAAAEISAEGICSNDFNMVIAGDIIHARDVYRSSVEFRPQAQHLYSCNELPTFRNGLNRGVRRRLMVVMFKREIPEDEEVADIGKRIAQEECDLLLHWAVEGALRVIPTGHLTRLASSEETIKDWILGHDPVMAWLNDAVTVTQDPEHLMKKADAYRYFVQWAESEGYSKYELPKQAGFTVRVVANSKITEYRNAEGRYLVGLSTENNPYNPAPRPQYGDPGYPSGQRANRNRAPEKSKHSNPVPPQLKPVPPVRADQDQQGRAPVAPDRDASVSVVERPEVVDPDKGEIVDASALLTRFPGSRVQNQADWQEPADQSPSGQGNMKPPGPAS